MKTKKKMTKSLCKVVPQSAGFDSYKKNQNFTKKNLKNSIFDGFSKSWHQYNRMLIGYKRKIQKCKISAFC